MSHRSSLHVALAVALLAALGIARAAQAAPRRSRPYRVGSAIAPIALARGDARSNAVVYGRLLSAPIGGAPLALEPGADHHVAFRRVEASGELISPNEELYIEQPEATWATSSAAVHRTGAEPPLGLRISGSYAAGKRVRLVGEYSVFSIPGEPTTRLHEAFLRVGLAL